MRSCMYLRPGNLYKNLKIKRVRVMKENGYPTRKYIDTGESVTGSLVVATKMDMERSLHRWDQDQHSLTHTFVVRGECTAVKNDLLTIGEKGYLVLTSDDVASLGIASILYLEERNDLT